MRADTRAASPQEPVKAKAKASSRRAAARVRLTFLFIVLVLLVMLYLPIRQRRLDDALVNSVLTTDVQKTRELLRNGADANSRYVNQRADDRKPSLWEWFRELFGHKPPPPKNTKTVLMLAASNSSGPMVNDLIAHRAEVNARLDDGTTALLLAAEKRSAASVRALLEHGAQLNTPDKQGRTPLLIAALFGGTEVVSVLLDRGANLRETDRNGNTPLLLAALNDHPATVETLLARGADRRQLDDLPAPPLVWAAGTGSLSLTQRFWQELVAEMRPYVGVNALCAAIRRRHKDVMEFLLAQGVPVNPPARPAGMRTERTDFRSGVVLNGSAPPRAVPMSTPIYQYAEMNGTPLSVAARTGDVALMRLLLAKGANVSAINARYEESALHAAVASSKPEIVALLLQRGADPNQRDGSNSTPLMHATRAEIARLLLDAGADPNAKDRFGQRPILAAFDAPLTRLLAERGADVNVADQFGSTPLMRAAQRADKATVQILLAHKAAPNARDKQHRTALTLLPATFPDTPALIDMLVKAGAKR